MYTWLIFNVTELCTSIACLLSTRHLAVLTEATSQQDVHS